MSGCTEIEKESKFGLFCSVVAATIVAEFLIRLLLGIGKKVKPVIEAEALKEMQADIVNSQKGSLEYLQMPDAVKKIYDKLLLLLAKDKIKKIV